MDVEISTKSKSTATKHAQVLNFFLKRRGKWDSKSLRVCDGTYDQVVMRGRLIKFRSPSVSCLPGQTRVQGQVLSLSTEYLKTSTTSLIRSDTNTYIQKVAAVTG